MRYDYETDRMPLTAKEQQEQDDQDDRRDEAIMEAKYDEIDWDQERLEDARMDAKRDHYHDSLIRDHDAGLHDVPGEEAPDCPSCEDRALDEAAAQAEQDEEAAK